MIGTQVAADRQLKIEILRGAVTLLKKNQLRRVFVVHLSASSSE
jgi:hypothetical protein